MQRSPESVQRKRSRAWNSYHPSSYSVLVSLEKSIVSPSMYLKSSDQYPKTRLNVGSIVGSVVGTLVGSAVGSVVGSNVGSMVGLEVGSDVGSDVGSII